MSLYLAVDTGGTFTDLAVYDTKAGQITYTKALTTHHRPLEGILKCVDKVGAAVDDAMLFKHGTTLVINTLLEKDGPPVALVTTRGFRDSLEFGRGSRMSVFELFYRKEEALAARNLRFEVTERVDRDGKVLAAPTREEVGEIARAIEAADVSAVAVSFINAYLNTENEDLVAQWLRDEMPGAFVTTGSALNKEWSEYERCSTAVANAYTGQKTGGHVAALSKALDDRGFDGQLMLMGSNGGLISGRQASEQPVLLVESGPVGGCLGAGVIGSMLGMDRIIAFDMGGTTAKCALVRDGEFDIQSTYYTDGNGRGLPIRVPVLDIVEVGAGGGSIGWLDEAGRLHVGPRSAGSAPGPAAYGRGGTEPTVTDANLFLGRLNAANFQGGEMALDLDATSAALGRVAEPLGFDGADALERLACGILQIASIRMSEAIKKITIQRGLDPRDFVLFAYGGGGPLHSVELARDAGITTVVIPPEPGNFSSLGMLLADIRLDEGRTFVGPINSETLGAARAAFQEIVRATVAKLTRDFGVLPFRVEEAMHLRYVGQHHAVRVPLENDDDDAAIIARFRQQYRDRYGHAGEGDVEFVSVHIVLSAETAKPALTAGEISVTSAPPTAETRRVYFATHNDWIETPVFDRRQLPLGLAANGPAVVEEYGSTTIIGPTDSFTVGALGEINITIGADPRRKA